MENDDRRRITEHLRTAKNALAQAAILARTEYEITGRYLMHRKLRSLAQGAAKVESQIEEKTRPAFTLSLVSSNKP